MRLLLHPGYPKTATTTLQENLLVSLHNDGKINFLGRSDFSDETEIQRLSLQIQEQALGSSPIQQFSGRLVPDLLNVYSNEVFLFPDRAIQGFETVPDRLALLFKRGGESSTKVLFVIRNQAALLYSIFVEKYKYLVSSGAGETPSEAIFEPAGGFKAGELQRIVDFNETIRAYEKVFGQESIAVLLYEDIEHDSANFCEQLAEILGIPASTVAESFASNKRRQKGKVDGQAKVLVQDSRRQGNHIAKLRRFFPVSSISWVVRSLFGENASNRLRRKLLGRTVKFVPDFSDAERRRIADRYAEGNQALASRYGICWQKMKDYEYVR